MEPRTASRRIALERPAGIHDRDDAAERVLQGVETFVKFAAAVRIAVAKHEIVDEPQAPDELAIGACRCADPLFDRLPSRRVKILPCLRENARRVVIADRAVIAAVVGVDLHGLGPLTD